MKWRLFEHKIQKNVSAQQADLDIDALWGAIEPAVDEINEGKKKRRGIIWWFWGGLLLVAVGVGYFNLGGEQIKEQTNIDHKDIAVEESPIIKDSTEKPVQSEASISENLNNQNSNSETQVGNNLTNHALKNNQKPTNNNFINNAENVSNSNKNKDSKKASSLANNDNENTFNNSSKKLKENANDVNTESPELIEKAAEVTVKNQDLVAKNNLENKVIVEKSKEESVEKEIAEITEKITQAETSTESEKTSVTQDLTNKEEIEKPETLDEIPPSEQKEDRKKDFNIGIALQGGISFTDQTLEAKFTDFETFRQNRDQTETSLETAQIGLFLTLKHKSGLSLTTGINHTQINERMNFNASSVNNDSIFGIQAFVENLNGGIDTIWGDIPNQITRTRDKEYFNKYKMLEIPILIGYEKELSEKFSLGVQAGVFANLSLKTEGQIWEGEEVFTNLEDSNIYRSKVGLSYHFSVSANYYLTENIGVYFAPFFRAFPQNFAEDSYGLNQKYKLFGGNVGVKFLF